MGSEMCIRDSTYGLKGLSAYSKHANVLLKDNDEVDTFLQKALAATLNDNLSVEDLIALTMETGKYGVSGMAMLDKANTDSYGNPEITKVNIGVRKNPGILVSGHDLRDLEMLLEQTQGTGVDVYTHSEMLPAHYYPAFKKYPNFVGNYGNAWWKQKEEFESFNGPILMTTNCIVPPKDSYKNRLYTTGAAGYPGCTHIPGEIGEQKNFSAIIEHAKKCVAPSEIETGEIIGGFAHAQVLALAVKVVEAVKSGAVETVKLNGEAIGDTYDTATLYQLKNFDFKLTADEQAVVNNYMGTLNIKYATYGINVKLNDLADVIYYDFGVGQSFISASEFIRLISDGGATFNQTVDSTSLYQVPMTFNGFTVSDTENNVYDTVKEIARKAVAAKLGVAEDASFETLAQKEGMTTDYQIESYTEYVVGNTIMTDLCKKALMNGNVDTTTSPYYTDILKGMVVRFGNNGNGVDLNKLNSEINAKLPKGYDANWQEGDSFFISDDELTQLRAFFSSVGGANATTNVVTNYFRDGEVTFNDKYADKKNKTVIVPASLKGSYTSEFWSLIAANQKKLSLIHI